MTDRKMDNVQKSYDTVADLYVQHIFGELEHKPIDRELLDRFAAALSPGSACDMGCGPGHVTRYLNDRGLEVTGFDLSNAMVDRAGELNSGIEFRQGDMRAPKLPTRLWRASRRFTRSSTFPGPRLSPCWASFGGS